MKPLHQSIALLALTVWLPAQAVLHYKFDGGCGSEVINFAPASSAAAGGATITTTAPGGVDAARIGGRYGQSLGGSGAAFGETRCDTGWQPSTIAGDFTFAMWLRNRSGMGSLPFGYLFGASGGSFRLFTGGSGRLFLSGMPSAVTSSADLTAQLNSGWVHVGCVVDNTSMSATFYIDGVAEPSVGLAAPVALLGTDFTIGARGNTGGSSSSLDTDEFTFYDRALLPVEILQMATATVPVAANGGYQNAAPSQCGAGGVQVAGVGLPVSGNSSYAIDVTATASSLVLLFGGLDRCQAGGAVPLPFAVGTVTPLLTGCFVVADPVVVVNGVAAGAPVTFPLPIPAGLQATSVYLQALGLDVTNLAASMSDGIAVSTGY
ncbi:MAG: LamG-like jellyroll fold domain-containing protein [Planctomycetota bacterium]